MKRTKSLTHSQGLYTHHIVFLVFMGILILSSIIIAIYEAFLKKPDPPKQSYYN